MTLPVWLMMVPATSAYFATSPVKWIGPVITGTIFLTGFVNWILAR